MTPPAIHTRARLRILTPADHRVMPWKNGQGTTTEIAASPPGADLASFAWRLSIADIGASGPFSAFPGVDRLLLQTEGEPMTLAHDGHGSRRLALLSPVRFPGEWATHGEVPAPPVRDFNIMSRRDRVLASAAVHELAPGSRVREQGPATARAIHLLRGAMSIRTLTASPTTSDDTSPAANEQASLTAGDTALLTGDIDHDTGFEVSIAPGSTGAVVIAVTFVNR